MHNMTDTNFNKDTYFQKTRRAVIWTNILNEPLQSLFYVFIPTILYQELKASESQITIFTMIKPLVALLSLYWSHAIALRSQKIVSNIIITGILARIPFFFVPLFDNAWLLIAATGCYTMLSRGGMPAWMEIMKQNLPEQERSKIFSFSLGFSYLEGVFLGIGMGILLDRQVDSWKWIFPLTACIGMLSIFFQIAMKQKLKAAKPQHSYSSVKEAIVSPWQEAKTLLLRRPDFKSFQWGYMLAGGGLMIMAPCMPLFFVDYLKITYTDLAIAISVCKGLGFAFSSPMWSRYLNRFGLYQTSAIMFFTTALFPLLLIVAGVHLTYLYLAYFCYGVAQAGSHLAWHLSGTIFAKDEDSHPYSNVSVLTIGLRGLVAPPLGGLMCNFFGPIGAFICCIFLCLWSAKAMLKPEPKLTPILQPE
jgi:F0F1-type ATP synthase assembly protein I